MVFHQESEISAPNTEGIHFSVQFRVHPGGFLGVSVRPDAFDLDGFPQQLDLNSFIAFRGSYTDANGTFHKASMI